MSLEPPEDRIYTLTARAIAVSDSSEIEEVMADLRAALKEHFTERKQWDLNVDFTAFKKDRLNPNTRTRLVSWY